MMVPSKENYYDIYKCLRDEVLKVGVNTKIKNNVKITKVWNGTSKDYYSTDENSYIDLDDRDSSGLSSVEENEYSFEYGDGNEYGNEYVIGYGNEYGNDYGNDYGNRNGYSGSNTELEKNLDKVESDYGYILTELNTNQESRKSSGYQTDLDTDQFYPTIL